MHGMLANLDRIAGTLHIYVVGLALFVAFSAKNLPALLLGATIIGVVYGNCSRLAQSNNVRRATVLIFLLALAALFTPVDLCLRHADSLRIQVLPVIVQQDTNYLVREMKREGKMIDRDFVVYDRHSTYNEVRVAVVVFMPGRK